MIRAEWKPRVLSYMGGIIRGMNGVAEIVSGVEDHVHLLISLRRVQSLADLMRDLKKDSTTWIKQNFDHRFAWQEGYAAFTVSPGATRAVRKHIAKQELHHARHPFLDELKQLLGRAGLPYDPKYLL